MLRRLSAFLLIVVAVLAAGWLAMRRADIPYGALETLYATDSSDFVTLKTGLVVHYTDEGPEDAPVILLLHGFASSSLTWEKWQADLRSDYRVISADLPGHGLTRTLRDTYLTSHGLAQYVEDFTQALDLNRFVIVGSSMGGHAAWLYALDHQETLDGLVLVAAAGLPGTETGLDGEPRFYAALNNPVLKSLLVDIDPTSLVRNGMTGAFADTSLATDELIGIFSDLARAPGHRRALMTLASRSRETAVADAERLKSLKLPVLILQGLADQIVAAEDAQRFAATIPDAELQVYEDLGHLPHHENPDETLQDLRAFLSRILPKPLVEDDKEISAESETLHKLEQ